MRRRHFPLLIFVLAASCRLGEGVGGPGLDPLPALEAVDFAQLGSARIAFRRIGPFPGNYDGMYWIDGGERTWGAGSQGVSDPAISPNGNRLAFRAPTGSINEFDVWVSSLEGADQVRLSSEPGNLEGAPSWTPDGRVIYAVFGRPLTVVRQAAVQSSVPETIGVIEGDVCPRMVPVDGPISVDAGGTLLFACRGDRVYSMAPNADPVQVVSRVAGMGRIEQAVWSPDGQRIAYLEWLETSATQPGHVRIHSVTRSGGDHNLVASVVHPAGARTWFGLAVASLCWTADGSRIVFTAPEADLVARVFVVSASGGTVTRLTSAPGTSDGSVSCRR
jgi:Tol biopolymer transport system component